MSEPMKSELIKRLRRIEGQTRGVQKMIEEDRNCAEILHQLNAINEAVRRVSLLLAEKYALECMDLDAPSRRAKSREAIADMLNVIARVPR